MGTIQLPLDFKEFLRLLNSEQVEYLLVGGYAVGFYGFPRTTGDMDIWLAATVQNAERVVRVLRSFGFSQKSIPAESLLQPNQVLRMGVPPLRIELLTSVSGLAFDDCYPNRNIATMGLLRPEDWSAR